MFMLIAAASHGAGAGWGGSPDSLVFGLLAAGCASLAAAVVMLYRSPSARAHRWDY